MRILSVGLVRARDDSCNNAPPHRQRVFMQQRRRSASCRPARRGRACVASILDSARELGIRDAQDLTAEDGLAPLPSGIPGAKAIADDGLVAEERVLHPALTMIPGRLLPLAPAELLHQRDRPIPYGATKRPRLANRRNKVGASGCFPSSLRECPTLCASSYSRPLAG